ncbi:MAG: hypothetical protein A3H69_04890 [Candidatus Sungbacteria bacterium RIFCSPLOWO2_02_FULL_47_9]|uniref:Methyltransferase type 11 domain-containing protein n=1 Tax=Candidatus Sungbacteria bacterium RIFCSPHIGHO2_01_FULL_47_32 TaxID=1802264 RepID=A0A1G2K6Q6_9BACT|nr:MAG: hypothetical protein UX72_C0006G0032 [Parcubacteria group bacterium GW2011_GWA2_47_10]OGZ95106.1 MAG: hypothetical protein A2633_06255 [Candidatus Sungbacteria bacterium RIFCSPHIGHO2_01_FULL_47_32]OGZ98180.1 MAG: hypothetical protein A3D57_03120 [Candidatus Sungbacteria bacterium RIFCSPHIGHO2_02_FULL_46_12]OHA05587.1 MAG: hypothetical protein A3A28_00250 [Candidatus Sungbacteria bacterium RIFCSPLOWO2_01_FULL_47_32]OHA11969.1 MAG: hypothetical protein A3H69_04890 [Candidatus Sungbacteria
MQRNLFSREPEEKDGRYYFTKAPDNIHVSKKMKEWSIFRKAQFQFVKDACEGLPEKSLLLDHGAGQSQFREVSYKFDRIGIDFVPYDGIDVIANVEEELPFKSGVFDIVFSTNSFEHIHNTAKAFGECARVLKSGGLIIGSTPFLLKVHQTPYDFHRFTNFELIKLFEEHGFEDVSIVPIGTTLDLLRQTALHYFGPKTTMGVGKIIWNLQKIILSLCRLLPKEKNTGLALGYGFRARKK